MLRGASSHTGELLDQWRSFELYGYDLPVEKVGARTKSEKEYKRPTFHFGLFDSSTIKIAHDEKLQVQRDEQTYPS